MSAGAVQTLVEVVIRVAVEHEEVAVAHLVEYAPAGFRHDEPRDGIVEFAVYVAPSQVQAAEAYLARAGVPVLDTQVVLVPGDWSEQWKRFHNAVTIGELWIGPPWLVDAAPAALKHVIIEPGQGFGTGAHATTRLVLELLLDQPRASVLDIGCGSGVLSVAASMLGFSPIVAIDNDPAAIQSTNENIERNDVRGVRVVLTDATADSIPDADIVLANLTLEPLTALAPRLHVPRIIASGILRSQAPAAQSMFEAAGYVMRERRDRDGWVAMVLDNADPECVMRHATAI